MKARQGHLFIVHFRLGQSTFTINNRHRKSLRTLTFVPNQWLLWCQAPRNIKIQYRSSLSIFFGDAKIHSHIDDRVLGGIHNRRWRTRCDMSHRWRLPWCSPNPRDRGYDPTFSHVNGKNFCWARVASKKKMSHLSATFVESSARS